MCFRAFLGQVKRKGVKTARGANSEEALSKITARYPSKHDFIIFNSIIHLFHQLIADLRS